MKLRETDKAIADYDAVLRLDPDDALARYSRGVARERLGDIAGATAEPGGRPVTAARRRRCV